MTNQSISKPYPIIAVQVWGHLTAECRARAIRLMVQLALTYIAAQIETYRKEVDNVTSIGGTQSTI